MTTATVKFEFNPGSDYWSVISASAMRSDYFVAKDGLAKKSCFGKGRSPVVALKQPLALSRTKAAIGRRFCFCRGPGQPGLNRENHAFLCR